MPYIGNLDATWACRPQKKEEGGKYLNNPKLDARERRKHEYYTLSGEEVGITEIHSTMPALNLSA